MKLPSRDTLTRAAAATLSGATLAVVAPPVNLHLLHWVVFLPLFWALREGEGKRNARLGYLAGFAGLALLFSWLGETMVRFSNLPWVVAALVVGIFSAAFAIPYALVFGTVHWLRRRFGLWWIWLTPAMQVAVEQLSPALFPYYHGVSQYQVPWTWQLASVTGVTGLSYLVFLVNCVLAEVLVYQKREGVSAVVGQGSGVIWKHRAAVAALVGATLCFGAWRYSTLSAAIDAAPKKRVALLQTDLQMDDRRMRKRSDIVRIWTELTRSVLDQKPDLVVWPEGAFPYNPSDPDSADFLGKLAREGNFDFLVGGGTLERHPPGSPRKYTAYNSVYLVTKDGRVASRYDKMVPLPFGEYIPFAETFPFLKDLIEGPGDFKAGTVATVFEADGYTFTTPICYEAILSSQMWRMKDADVFVNVTNDAWFGDTAAPRQHAMLSAVQAMHFGRPMVRVAYTGINMIISPNGDIEHETLPFVAEAKVVEFPLIQVETFYRQAGWLFPWICVLLSGGALVAGRRRSGSDVTPPPSNT